MDLIILYPLCFFAGVGLGTFVLSTLLRRIIAETVQTVKNDIAKVQSLAIEAENALKAARKALP